VYICVVNDYENFPDAIILEQSLVAIVVSSLAHDRRKIGVKSLVYLKGQKIDGKANRCYLRRPLLAAGRLVYPLQMQGRREVDLNATGESVVLDPVFFRSLDTANRHASL